MTNVALDKKTIAAEQSTIPESLEHRRAALLEATSYFTELATALTKLEPVAQTVAEVRCSDSDRTEVEQYAQGRDFVGLSELHRAARLESIELAKQSDELAERVAALSEEIPQSLKHLPTAGGGERFASIASDFLQTSISWLETHTRAREVANRSECLQTARQERLLKEAGFDSKWELLGAVREARGDFDDAKGFLGIRGFLRPAELHEADARLKDLLKIQGHYESVQSEQILGEPLFKSARSPSHPADLLSRQVVDPLMEHLEPRLKAALSNLAGSERERIEGNLRISQHELEAHGGGRAPHRLLADILATAARADLQEHGGPYGNVEAEKFLREELLAGPLPRSEMDLNPGLTSLSSDVAHTIRRVCGGSLSTVHETTAALIEWAVLAPKLEPFERAARALGDLMGIVEVKDLGIECNYRKIKGQDVLAAQMSYGALDSLQAILERCDKLAPTARGELRLWTTLLGSHELEPLSRIALGGVRGEAQGLTASHRAAAQRCLSRCVVDDLLVSAEHQDVTVALGWNLYQFTGPELIPIKLINAVREPGYSGEWPFQSGSESRPSMVVSFAQGLSSSDLLALRDNAMPGVYEALSLLRDHGQTALVLRAQREDGEWIDNPLRAEFEGHIERAARGYLERGSPKERQHVVATFKYLSKSLEPETKLALEEAFAAQYNPRLFVELLRFVERRGEHKVADLSPSMTKVAVLSIAAAKLPEFEAQRFAEKLFMRLPSDTQNSDEVASVVSSIFHKSRESVFEIGATTLGLKRLGILSEDGKFGSFELSLSSLDGVSLTLPHALKLASIPAFLSSLEVTFFTPDRSLEEARWYSRMAIELVSEPARLVLKSPEQLKKFCELLVMVGDARSIPALVNDSDPNVRRWAFKAFKSVGECLLVEAQKDGREGLERFIREKPLETFNAIYAVSQASVERVDLLGDAATLATLVEAFPSHKDTAALIEHGVPLLFKNSSIRRSLSSHLEMVKELFPIFLREGASSDDAWACHAANLQRGSASFLTSPDFELKAELRTLLEFQRHFPGVQAPVLYRAFRAIGRQNGGDELQRLGLVHKDIRAVHELKTRIAKMRGELLESEAPVIVKDDLDREIVAAIIGHGGSFQELAPSTESFQLSHQRGLVAPLDPRLKDIAIEVDLFDIERVKTFKFSEPTQVRYAMFRRDLFEIQGRSFEKVLNTERDVVISLLGAEKRKIEQAILSAGTLSPGERRGREQELKRIETALASVSGAPDLSGFMKAVCDYKAKENSITSPSLRRLALRSALDQVSDEAAVFTALEECPTKLALETVVSLVQTNFKNEALAEEPYKSLSPKQREAIQFSIGTASFKDDFKRLEQIDSVGKERIVVHPTRGILGELSGYNCSACWTRERGIMARYPNVTALMYIKNADEEMKRRIVGACLIMQVKATSGEEVLVIRGINPTQNFITTLKPESFFERFVDDAIVPYARALGISTIVIPEDGISGGAKTNRPSIGLYVSQHYGKNPRVLLDTQGPTSTFNGYPIHDRCVLVRKLDGKQGAR